MTLRIRTIVLGEARASMDVEGYCDGLLMPLGADTPAEALRAACQQVHPEVVALSCVRRREAEGLQRILQASVEACAPALVVVGGPGAREHAESTDELVALWQQVRGALNRT
jgi:MerR family transcriptional regulator, light-induced transcriptional regulator